MTDQQQRSPKADAKAAKAYYKASRPWYKKKRWIALIALAVIILISVISSHGGGGSTKPVSDTSGGSAASTTASPDSNSGATKASTPKKPSNQLNADAGALNKVVEGKAYQLGDFKIHKGWTVRKSEFLGYEVNHFTVENTTQDAHQFDVAIKLHSGPGGKRIVNEIDCIANSANPGDIVDADCIATGQGSGAYDYITVENAL